MDDQEWHAIFTPKLARAEQALVDFNEAVARGWIHSESLDSSGVKTDTADVTRKQLEETVAEYRSLLARVSPK